MIDEATKLPRGAAHALPLYLGNLLVATGRLRPDEVWNFATEITRKIPAKTVEGIEEQLAEAIDRIRSEDYVPFK